MPDKSAHEVLPEKLVLLISSRGPSNWTTWTTGLFPGSLLLSLAFSRQFDLVNPDKITRVLLTTDGDGKTGRSRANLSSYCWQKHCRGLYQTPIAA